MGKWDERLGPKPDESGCRIAPEILAEFGSDSSQRAGPARSALH
jgi:hypothetical protein